MKEDLDRKEGAAPPGIEIPGIPARKLVKWKRALAVGLDALTVAVAVATIRQMLTDGGVLSAIPLSALLIAVTAAAAWFSWRARRG